MSEESNSIQGIKLDQNTMEVLVANKEKRLSLSDFALCLLEFLFSATWIRHGI